METLVVVVFVLGYLAITMEHSLKLDKLIPALLMMVFAWTIISLGLDGFTNWFDSHAGVLMNEGFTSLGHEDRMHLVENTMLHHFGKTAEILIFLIGAMTIVEIIDFFDGFATIKGYVKTNSKRTLLWIVSILAFFLSSIIDNLTATIVLITILRKLLPDSESELRMWYAGFIIVAANAGGAWTPIGDVTTTMLWMGEKVSTVKLIEYLLVPSILCLAVPLAVASVLPTFKGTFQSPTVDTSSRSPYSKLFFYLGLAMIVFVPVFKTITHLPPYVGMMLSLSIMAILGEIMSNRQLNMSNPVTEMEKASGHNASPTLKALSKVEMPSILFFLGILMTVASLETLGLIFNFGQLVQTHMNNELFILLLGASSAIIDNVPLVAASMGMFDMTQFPMDDHVWHFIAFAAGTGGSMLIIGSAAGVVAMGMEKISFFWYMKKIAWLAMIGYLVGYGFMMLIHS